MDGNGHSYCNIEDVVEKITARVGDVVTMNVVGNKHVVYRYA
jgi:hypothetical protein